MTKLLTENLFLLEFLVDDLQMNARCDCQTPPGELCVTFQFLDNAPLEIAESDFCPRGNGPEIDNTKSGKSCLFSMTPQRISSSLNEFGVFISVCKKMQPGWAPDKINMANADISISNLFRELVNSVEMNQGKSPAAKTLKDEFELFDEMGCCIGKISIYIRMSCFGKLIVTQFQMNLEDKTVLFKDKEGQSLYRYKKSKKKTGSCAPTCPRAPCPPPRNDSTGGKSSMNGCPSMGGSIGPNRFPPPGGMMGQPSAMMGTTPGMVLGGAPPMAPPSSGFGFGNCPGGQRIPGGMSPIMSNGRLGGGGGSLPFAIDNNAVNAPLGLKGNGENLYGMRNDIMGLGNYPGNNPYVQLGNGSIQEFFNLGNNSVNDIYRVGKPCLDDNPLFSMSFNNQFCNQGFSPLSSMLSPTPPLPPPPPQQIYDGFRMTAGDDECPCSGCGDSAPQGGANSAAFNFRPGVAMEGKDEPFSMKITDAGAGNASNMACCPPQPVSSPTHNEIADPNKEIFVLRIGKKTENMNKKKNNLEVELCTPKSPDIRPKPVKETRESQYDPKDIPPAAGAKGGAKGKGKK